MAKVELNALIDNVFRIWKETGENRYTRLDGQPYDKPGAGQLIFSDLGTQSVADKRGFSAYDWIRERLIARGVPESEIAFVQDYRKAAAKKRLFDDFNAGLKRILLGASDNLGTGANVQRRLKALHHLDVPWMPSKIEQREGRSERQGNEHDEVEIYAYATTGSMDATMWQSNERKMRFIVAAFRGDRTVRRLEDLQSSQAGQFALAKALASGDERLLRKAGLESDIARLERLRVAHFDDQMAIRHQVWLCRNRVDAARKCIPQIETDISRRDRPSDPANAPHALTIDGLTYENAASADATFIAELRTLVRQRFNGQKTLGEFRSFPIVFKGIRLGAEGYEYEVLLERTGEATTLAVTLSPVSPTLIMCLQKTVNLFETEMQTAHATLAREQERIADFESRLGIPWAFETELEAKRTELDSLDKELAGLGDTSPDLSLDDAA